jgi:hypothetical protein
MSSMQNKPETSRKPRLFKDENHLLLASLILGIATLVIINAAYVVNRLTAPAPVTETTPTVSWPHVLRSTQTARTPALIASVGKVSESDKADPAFTLDDGETLLAMDLSITNRTAGSQDFIPTSDLYVHTSQGDYRPLHPSMYVTQQIFSGTMKPGQTVSGQISFSVPKQATDPLLYIDTGWNSEVPVVFAPLK